MLIRMKIATVLLLIVFTTICHCDEHEHTVSSYEKKVFLKFSDIVMILLKEYISSFQYTDGEEVVVWMNTVGPYHNRQETYAYFSLPFCQGPKVTISHYHETLGEALQGTELEFSGLQLDFKSE